jgi:Glutaminase
MATSRGCAHCGLLEGGVVGTSSNCRAEARLKRVYTACAALSRPFSHRRLLPLKHVESPELADRTDRAALSVLSRRRNRGLPPTPCSAPRRGLQLHLVVAGKGGLAVYSPGLDAFGNSVRGVAVCRELSAGLGLHVFATEAEDAVLGPGEPEHEQIVEA